MLSLVLGRLLFVFVADGAIHLVLDGDAGSRVGRGPAGVALHAGDAGMARAGQFSRVDVERTGSCRARPLQVGIGVAAQAIAVGHPLRVENLADFVRLHGNRRRPGSGAAASPTTRRGSPGGARPRFARGTCVQVLAMFCLAMEERGSVWGSTLCAVWQLVQTAVTVRPCWKRPMP